MVKILISGKAGSGKNLTANIFEKYWLNLSSNNKSSIKAFADPIKEIVLKMFPKTSKEILWGSSELRMTKIENTTKTYRELLIDIGKLGRGYLDDIWINAIIDYGENLDKNHLFIITDGRYQNELSATQKKNYFLIRVIRPVSIYDDHSLSKDISETDLDNIPNSIFDAIIINDGTKEELEQKIYKIFEQHINPKNIA